MEKASVFVVNSLSSGGAERVANVLANNMKDDKVFIITFLNKMVYEVGKNIEVINLQEKEKMGKIEKFLKLPFLIRKFNKEYKKIKENYNITLSTSHLIYSHLACRLSKYKDEIAYVIHNPYYPLDENNSKIFKCFLKFLYKNKKIITVAKGVEKELQDRYEIKTNTISTIYNPIDFDSIYQKMNEKVNYDNYIMFCGRLTEQKRPIHAIEMFYKNELYKECKLLMIGTGELADKVKEKIKEYKLEDYVVMIGWTSNPYAYMKNSLLMFNCSYWEAFPMTLIEALATGTKVVSYDINYGPNELLTGNLEKYLVKYDDISRFGEVIKNTIKEEREDYSSILEKYKIENIVKEYYDIYKKWCENEG